MTLPSINIPHLFIIRVCRLKAPVNVPQNIVYTELVIAAGYVRYGGNDCGEDSAILVFDPQAKTPSGAQGPP